MFSGEVEDIVREVKCGVVLFLPKVEAKSQH